MPIKKYIPLSIKQRVRALQNRVKLISSKLFCPVCESRVSAFMPLPAFFKENREKYGFPFRSEEVETCNEQAYLCPFCQATDRERLYALFLGDYIETLDELRCLRMLDFGPSRPLSEFIHRLINKTPGDIHYRTADLLAEDVDDKVDIIDLRRYESNHFDFFLCSHILEHVPDDRKALSELYRILKPGGKGIVMVPIILTIDRIDEETQVVDAAERWKRFGQFDHVRLYSKNGFLERVRSAGFDVHEYGKERFGEQAFYRTGISDQSVLYVAEKKLV